MPEILSPKENLLRCLRHEKTQYTPCIFLDAAIMGGCYGQDSIAPLEGGLDDFGVKWIVPDSVRGGGIPEPNNFVLDDITNWKKLKFPDPDAYDWEKLSAAELSKVDRGVSPVGFNLGFGVFDRHQMLMGFMNALISLIAEPEAVWDFYEALTDYKLRLLEKAIYYYRPDMIMVGDDTASAQSLFMSTDTYRTLVKPQHKRLYDRAKAEGIFVVQHNCGRAAPLIPDFIDEGIDCWSAVRPDNDLAKLLEVYAGSFSFEGGFDTGGAPSLPTATEADIRAEVRRCMSDYGSFGQGYIFSGHIVRKLDDSSSTQPMDIIFDEFKNCRKAQLAAL